METNSTNLRLTCVVGARPNFPKMAPIIAAARDAGIAVRLVHTGQHYDQRLSECFFADLGLPRPDIDLGVGSSSHAVQTGRVMEAFDAVLDADPTDAVVVVGDVNSTLACALVAVKRGIRVAHVEAGLRSFDRGMPEEINRVLTDQISDFLFTTERSAEINLVAEGIPCDRIHFVGNVMIDTLLRHREQARLRPTLTELNLVRGEYAVCTIHRPSNVDTIDSAKNTVRALSELGYRLPLVLPLHPRTRLRLAEFGLLGILEGLPGARVLDPLGYFDFLALMDGARVVFTDSGGIQEETTALGVACLTFRNSTERPITIAEGTNTLIGTDARRVGAVLDTVLAAPVAGRVPELWDGAAGARIVKVLQSKLPLMPGTTVPTDVAVSLG